MPRTPEKRQLAAVRPTIAALPSEPLIKKSRTKMLPENALSYPDDLHPSVIMSLERCEFLHALAEHFPDIYRILNQYAELVSVKLDNSAICERVITIAGDVQRDLQLLGCIPSDTRLFSEFASAITKDACSFDIKTEQPKNSQKRTQKILTNSARRMMARQRVVAHA